MKSKRWIIAISFSFAVLFIPVSALLYTEQGLNWFAQIISQNVPGKLSFNSVKGSLASKIEITNLDYQDADIAIDIAHVKIIWQPWKLLSGLLLVDFININDINIRTLSTTTAKTPLELPDINLPFRFSLQDINLNSVILYTNNDESSKFNNIKLSAKSHNRSVIIPEFIAKTDDFNLSLNGKFIPVNDYIVDAVSTLQFNNLFSQPFTIAANFNGDLKQLNAIANVTGFVEGRIKGKLYDVVNQIQWSANADINKLNLKSFSADLPANNITGEIQSDGTIDHYTLNGNAVSHFQQWGGITAIYRAAIVGSELIIDNFQLQEKSHPALIRSQGSINWGGEETIYNLAGGWQKISWPWLEEAKYHSPSGTFNFSGKMSDYNLNVDTEIAGNQIPFSVLTAEASGNNQKIDIRAVRVNTLDGYIAGSGLLDWQKEFRWNANLNFTRLNPKSMLPEISGEINASLKANGSTTASSHIINVGVNNISGNLQSKPLSGSADVRFTNDDIQINQFNLKLDETKLALKGNLGSSNNFKFKFGSKDLSGFFPDLQGGLNTSGKVLGSLDMPRLILDLSASNLTYNNYSLASITTVADISMDPQQNLKFDLVVDNFKKDDTKVDNLQLNLNGALLKHQIELKIKNQKDVAELSLGGGVINNVWQGKIIESTIKSKSIGDWQLEKSSQLLVGILGLEEAAGPDKKYTIKLEKNCYIQNQTNVCFNADYNEARLTAGFEWRQLAIEKFQYWFPSGITISTLLNGSAKLEYSSEKQIVASVSTTNTKGNFTVALDTGNQLINFNPGEIAFDWNPLQIKTSIRLPLGDQSKIEANAFIDRSNVLLPIQQQPLKGNVLLQLPTLIFLEPVIPVVKNLDTAHAEAKLQISGSLQLPAFSGNASAGSDQLHIPGLNVTLSNTEIRARFDKKQFVVFDAETTSGQGKVKITGEAAYTEEKTWSGKSSIRGAQFIAIDLPESTVQVSPELTLQLINNTLLIQGDITVPYARLHPKKMLVGTATESSDLVIVGNDTKSVEDTVRWNTESKVRLILGDRVSFDGFGLRSKLEGSLQIIDRPNEVTIGRGEINLVNGFYRSFGQELQISKGRFLFANTSVDDPSLDIRAHRLVGEIKAGVHVTSTLRKPEVRLFSEPIMSESDTLSYLLLGRPVRQIEQSEGTQLMTAATAMGLAGGELLARTIGNRLGIEEVLIQTDVDSGASSLVIGRYLSPKLYIRYFAGIFERSNIVQLRYKASEKVIIQTETGSQMGADVFYTIER